MKVLLKQDVDNLGYAGEIFKVSPGYGRNYLIPQGLAVPATESTLKQAKAWMDQAAVRREQMKQEYKALVERLENASLIFEAKAGESGKLYGSVTTADIVEKLNAELGIEVDRRKVEGSGLRQVGSHKVGIRLDSQYRAVITVDVQPEGGFEVEEDTAEEESVVTEEVEELVEEIEDTVSEIEELAEEIAEEFEN